MRKKELLTKFPEASVPLLKCTVTVKNLPQPATEARAFATRAQAKQQLAASLQPHYDFIVCGAGSSGSVVARRLAENPAARVLLLEAGGSDDVPAVLDPEQ